VTFKRLRVWQEVQWNIKMRPGPPQVLGSVRAPSASTPGAVPDRRRWRRSVDRPSRQSHRCQRCGPVRYQIALVHFRSRGRDGPPPSCYAVTGWRWTRFGRPATNVRFSAATPMAASRPASRRLTGVELQYDGATICDDHDVLRAPLPTVQDGPFRRRAPASSRII
jgi:hypothetical protein